jgi:hypothetical protein
MTAHDFHADNPVPSNSMTAPAGAFNPKVGLARSTRGRFKVA